MERCGYSADYSSHFSVGGVSVRVAGDHLRSVALALPLMPFSTELTNADIDLRVEWVDRLRSCPDRPLFDSGALWRLHESADDFRFEFTAAVFGNTPYKELLVDHSFARATLRVSETAMRLVPDTAPLDYPLDELLIMHRLTQEKAIELHGCGIVRANGVGNLFVGHSGAGKSTTTRLWTERGNVEVLSDDRIIVRRESSNTGRMLIYGTPWHGEAHYASPGSAPLSRIFVLEHGDRNRLTRLTESQAVAELFARSFVPFHRHEYVDCALSFLQELVSAVPVFRYDFEPDQRAVDTILNLHD